MLKINRQLPLQNYEHPLVLWMKDQKSELDRQKAVLVKPTKGWVAQELHPSQSHSIKPSLLATLIAEFLAELSEVRIKIRKEFETFLAERQEGGVLTTQEAADYLRCSLTQIKKMVRHGRIKIVAFDDHHRFRRRTLDAFLEQNER